MKLKLKKVDIGYYETQIGNTQIEVYRANGSNSYWSSTITIGKYGDDDYKEESIQAPTKKELVGYIQNFITE